MANIYTRRGDGGQTALADGSKVPKSSCHIRALGAVDELNSLIGLACAYCKWSPRVNFYVSLQSDLFVVGSILGGVRGLAIDQSRIAYVEEMIDDVSGKLTPLGNFILPGGELESAWLHYMRAVCRRAECEMVALGEQVEIDPNLLIYINRLSDLMFVLARLCNDEGRKDVLWSKPPPLRLA